MLIFWLHYFYSIKIFFYWFMVKAMRILFSLKMLKQLLDIKARTMFYRYQNLIKEFRTSKERCQNAEKSNKVTKTILFDVLD